MSVTDFPSEPVVGALTLIEFGEQFRLSRATVYRELAAGRLHGRKVGHKTILLANEVQRWVNALPDARRSAAR